MSTGYQTNRKTYQQTFQLRYQNKSCSECQQDVREIERHAHRQTGRKTFELSYQNKTKIQNVHMMSKSQSDRQEDIQCAKQTDNSD